MSTDRDVTRIVRSWLEEGVNALPDRVLDNVLDRLPATHQRRSWWPARRLHEMNTPLRIALAAAAVLVVALLGITILPRVGGVAAPAPTPSPTPTPTPTPSASPKAVVDGPLTAGAYFSRPFAQPGSDACFSPPQPGCIDSTNDDSIRVMFHVPDGWSGTGQDGVVPTGTQNKAPDGAAVLFVRGASLYNDPCKSADAPEIPVGPSVDAFATALADHPLLDVTTPVDVTLAGYSGKYIDLQVPADLSACGIDADGIRVYRPWEPWFYAQGPSQRWHLWILDVHGVRVVVQSTDYAGTSPQHEAELKAIVESIQIES